MYFHIEISKIILEIIELNKNIYNKNNKNKPKFSVGTKGLEPLTYL
jgi:hypothetical protein